MIPQQVAAAAAKLFQLCPTLRDPIDSSPPGSPVPGILQAGTLERVAISFSNAWKWKVRVKLLSHVRLLVTPWTAAHQAPPSMGFPGKSTGMGCLCLLQPQQVRLWLTSFPWGQALSRAECSGVSHNSSFSFPSAGSRKECFSEIYCGNLVELLEVNLKILCEPLYAQATLDLFTLRLSSLSLQQSTN